MGDVLSLAEKLDAKRAAEARRHQQFRDDLAALGFDPAMADWTLTWEEGADGKIIPGSTGLIVPERSDG